MIIIKRKELITVKINYFIPDYTHIINEFLCQYEDIWPEIPRVHKFLNYWKDNIDAKINEIFVMKSNVNWRKVDWTNRTFM